MNITISRPLSWVSSKHYLVCLAAIFLVSVPVFFQAPLVRVAPVLSLLLSVGILGVAQQLLVRMPTWGSLVWGFSLSWICGSIYWGWLRSEPIWHLPIEAVALPWAIWACRRSPKHQIGAWFYLGSLIGTAITDLYFWRIGVIAHWRSLMQPGIDQVLTTQLLKSALIQVEHHPAILITLAIALISTSLWGCCSVKLYKWAFAGAIFSTLIVDLIFGWAAWQC
ncbi:MAG: DUF3120 domain-containing protein [Pseudanabaenaceae cyanobacterium bins.68]|nr:DUF3120 domain-containing protein [Pseudanabaenaceae cyanobacterium bins.68]